MSASGTTRSSTTISGTTICRRAPLLADITVGGRAIKAVVQVTKQAFAFVFDRTNGQPVWPIEERPVPASDTPGERTSPTQPFPTKPPPFDRQGVTVDDLIDFTPELRAEAIELVKQYRIGPLFTPPSIRGDGPGATRGTVQLPGSVGGADWQGAAFDPETRHALRAVDHRPVRRRPRQRRSEADEPQLRPGPARLPAGPAGAAATEAAIRPHHGDRSEAGRHPLDGAERRRPARPSAAEAAQPAAARQPRSRRDSRDEDAALRRRGRLR